MTFIALSTASFIQLNRYEAAFVCNSDVECSAPVDYLNELCCQLPEEQNAIVVELEVDLYKQDRQEPGRFKGGFNYDFITMHHLTGQSEGGSIDLTNG